MCNMIHWHVTWPIDMCDMTHWHLTWLIDMYMSLDVGTWLHARHDSFICATWFIDMWHDSLICATSLIDMWHDSLTCNMSLDVGTWLHAKHDSFMCVTWLIHIWHDSFKCDTTHVSGLMNSPEESRLTKALHMCRPFMYEVHTDIYICYRVAMTSRLLKMIGLFCKRAL